MGYDSRLWSVLFYVCLGFFMAISASSTVTTSTTVPGGK